MNAQQEAVALWKFLESRGITPSIRKVVAMMRAASIPVNEKAASGYLAEFATRAPHPKSHSSKIPAQRQHESRTSSSTPAAQIRHNDQHDSSTSAALYAHDKVSLVSKLSPTILTDSVPPAKTRTTAPRIRVKPVRRDDDFGDCESDVQAVIANDAASRRDGLISVNVIDGLRQKLARARSKHGPDAFAAGLGIAIDRGKGADYAAGCMKHWQPGDERGGARQRSSAHEPPEREHKLFFLSEMLAEKAAREAEMDAADISFDMALS